MAPWPGTSSAPSPGASPCSARACDLSRGIVVHQAAAAPLTNPGNVDVVSPRVGNYRFNPAADGILFDQLWLR